MEIERYIPEGKEFAISRKELKALLGKDDRTIREWIKQANRRLEADGKVILSSSTWKGVLDQQRPGGNPGLCTRAGEPLADTGKERRTGPPAAG